ncbi:MAG: Rne/Rng family ribonuclease [Candidatus Omnitrophica bacterium]|nr:Rne/Rng family ribonuclease [Candidatus Omnitrophota bacterium]
MSREIIINATPEENKVAIKNHGKLEEFYIERQSGVHLVGSIYKGRVESILPGIGGAFVNIGLEKNGFLYVDDIIEEGSPYSDILEEEMGDSIRPKDRPRTNVKVSDILKKGQELLVQVVKEPISTKGARLTAHITLPGRYLVFMAHDSRKGISKKVKDVKERKRIRSIIDQWKLPKDIGVIVRTAAIGHSVDELKREMQYLYNVYRRAEKAASKKSAPALIYEEHGLIQRIARDSLTEDTSGMVIDSKFEYKKTAALLKLVAPRLRGKLKFYKGHIPIFEKYQVAREIKKIYERRVQLPSKGYIVIEPTESLVSIDVNTGSFSGKHPEETAFIVNKEAAVEIARQLRLRDMGGIIVIDFVDMEQKDHRNIVFRTLLTALKSDKARTRVLNFSSIGLVEMTRQRVRRSLESVSYQACPYCQGRGIVKSPLTISIEIIRELEGHLRGQRYKKVEIDAHSSIKNYLLEHYKNTFKQLGRRTRSHIMVNGIESLHVEEFKINVK